MKQQKVAYYDKTLPQIRILQSNLSFRKGCLDRQLAVLTFHVMDECREIGGLLEEFLVVMLGLAKKHKDAVIRRDTRRCVPHYLMAHAKYFAKELEKIKGFLAGRNELEEAKLTKLEEKRMLRSLMQSSKLILARLSLICDEVIDLSKPEYMVCELAEDFGDGKNCFPIQKEEETCLETIQRTEKALMTFILIFQEIQITTGVIPGFNQDERLAKQWQQIEESLYLSE